MKRFRVPISIFIAIFFFHLILNELRGSEIILQIPGYIKFFLNIALGIERWYLKFFGILGIHNQYVALVPLASMVTYVYIAISSEKYVPPPPIPRVSNASTKINESNDLATILIIFLGIIGIFVWCFLSGLFYGLGGSERGYVLAPVIGTVVIIAIMIFAISQLDEKKK